MRGYRRDGHVYVPFGHGEFVDADVPQPFQFGTAVLAAKFRLQDVFHRIPFQLDCVHKVRPKRV